MVQFWLSSAWQLRQHSREFVDCPNEVVLDLPLADRKIGSIDFQDESPSINSDLGMRHPIELVQSRREKLGA